MLNAQNRFALVGPSGAGKSTTAFIMQRLLQDAVVCSVATPIRDIQDYIYGKIGHISPTHYGIQDGIMLQNIRSILFSSDPDFLHKDFKYRVAMVPEKFTIINDDCRLAMHATLVDLGFIFIWIEGDQLRHRGDVTLARSTSSAHDQIISPDACNYRLTNLGSLANLANTVENFLKQFPRRQPCC